VILSGQSIRARGILEPFAERTRERGLSFGLGPSGYDLRLVLEGDAPGWKLLPGEFILAATLERFTMPRDLTGIVHDKSSLARLGLSVFNTVIEPGWRGWLTLELANKGPEPILLHRHQGIAQVIFHVLDAPAEQPYPEDGKYQDQEFGPQGARQ
jgi:dCTP deaminase